MCIRDSRYTEAYGYAEPDRTYKDPGTYTGSCEKAKEYYKSQNEIKKKEDACRIDVYKRQALPKMRSCMTTTIRDSSLPWKP